MVKIGIVVGTTRPGRKALAVGKWVMETARLRQDAQFELVDIADYALPLLDEAMPASMGPEKYGQPHTKSWSEKVSSLDGFVFVTPEYNHSVPASLKNAIDFLYKEWNNKAAGVVSYGASGGVRAAEHLRQILGEVQVADVRAQVPLSLSDDFENYSVLKPRPRWGAALTTLLDQVVAWSTALRPLHSPP